VRRTAALIVGGGPAGSAAAIGLARAGLEPLLIERSAAPHDVVCGGFLGWDALAALGRLGVDAGSLGARPIRRLRLLSSTRCVETALPRSAAGLSRRRLDAALLARAAEAGAELVRGRAARSAEPGRRCVRLDDGEEIEAKALLLATGKYELRGVARPADTGTAPVGLRTALGTTPRLQAELEGMIELHLFDGGYAGLLLQEDGAANLCLSISRTRLKAAGGIEPLIAALALELPRLAERIGQSGSGEWLAVAGVPYGWRTGETEPGLYRVGDQAAVIASLAGDGIAVALESGTAAAQAVAAGMPAPAYQRAFAGRAARPLRIAETLRWAAEHRGPRRALMELLRWAPGLAPLGARLTRIG
jgi:flavin-dependent dehydrogenase